MPRQKFNQPTGASAWAVSDLTEAYQANSAALTRRAFRYLQNEQQAEDVVQEAFIKVLLAAPELNDAEHLIAYLNKTVTNLCLDIRKSQNRGPLLVAVDSETSADLLDDLAHESHVELDETLTRAEDAAIVREAISRLSEVDRAVLLSIHLEQKTTAETAKQFGVTEGTVRNALMRARRNLRTTLEEWIIDEETGMTAAQYLSRTGKKIAENSKKIGSAALSLVLLVAAFFGFWNNPTTPAQIAAPKVAKEVPTTVAAPATNDDDETESLIAQLQAQISALSGFASTLSSIQLSVPKFNIPGPTPLFAKTGAFDVLENDYAVTGDASAIGEVLVICSINPDGTLNARFFAATDKGALIINQNFAIDVTTVNANFEINGASSDLHVVAVQSKLTDSGLTQLDFTIVADRDVLTGIAKPQGFGITIVLNSTLSAVTGQNVSIATVPALSTPLTNSARLALPGATP